MKRIEARIKTGFGEFVIEGETAQEILELLETIPGDFVEKVSSFVSERLTPSGAQLKGIIEVTTEGPVDVGGACAVCAHPAFSRRGIAARLLDEAHSRMRAGTCRSSP